MAIGGDGGGSGGAGNDGGSVYTYNDSDIFINTYGSDAAGLMAQSIGGGGGLGGDATGGVLSVLTSGENASGGASGNGGAITLDIGAPIAVTGQDAIGVVAQSIGGGGGLGGSGTGAFAGVTSSDGSGTGGDVALTISDKVSSTGTRGIGVFAQSQGPDGNDEVTITANSGGQIFGGYSDSSSAVMVAGGNGNSLVLNGDAVVESGSYVTGNDYDDNYAVRYSGSGTTAEGAILDVTVNDTASLHGDVLPENADGNTAGTVTNNSPNTLAGGYFYGAHIVNNGRFVLNRAHDTGTTVLTGNFVQSDAGELVADIDLNNNGSDLFDIRGDASLQVTSVDGFDLRLEYDGRFSDKLATNSGSLRVSIPF